MGFFRSWNKPKDHTKSGQQTMASNIYPQGSGSYVVSNPGHTHGGLTTSQAYQQYNQQYAGVGVGVNNQPYQQGTVYNTIAHACTGGGIMTVSFTDAKGLTWAMDVDQGLAPALSQISQQHQYLLHHKPTYGAPTHVNTVDKLNLYRTAPMLEGDFSEDEMTQAEQIIEEMRA